MTETNIRLWAKLDGSWDVTLHADAGRRDGYLHDSPQHFKNFKTRREAETYAFTLFLRRFKLGNLVELASPDSFGQESTSTGLGHSHCWCSYSGSRWMIRLEKDGKMFFWSSPNLADDKSRVPRFVLKELNKRITRAGYIKGRRR